MASRVGIALGSNLGDRLANLRQASRLIRNLSPVGVHYEQAPVFLSAPVDCHEDDPDFFNTAIEIDYVGTPHQLLQSTQMIEFQMGREIVREMNSPRVIDIDLLYFDDLVVGGDILTLPHPKLTNRRFVLQPLAEIRPHLILPGDRATIAEHLRRLDSDEPELTMIQATW